MTNVRSSWSHPRSEPATGVQRIAVLGAGTMGAGIAQLAIQSGYRTTVFDPDPVALNRARTLIADGLDRVASRGKVDPELVPSLLDSCRLGTELASTADADLVIEAAPEVLELKLQLFDSISAIVDEQCVLATNTSSFSVTAVAASATHPERVVGMHFFNPAPVMRLLEVVAGDQSASRALQVARAVGERMGKRVIDAADIAGFLVNRCNRPFSLEALRLLEQRVASVEQIDRIARMQGRFRMGPFELMDLVGIETNHAVAESMQRQSYGEPRYRPSPLAARKVAAGTLGRKSGRGWYSYASNNTATTDVAPAPSRRANGRRLVIAGELVIAQELRSAAAAAGFQVSDGANGDDEPPWLVLDCGTGRKVWPDQPRGVLVYRGSLHATAPDAVGFHVLPPLEHVKLLELTTTPLTNEQALGRVTELAAVLGWRVERVADTPGLVLGRIVAQLINEAAFLQQEHSATPEDIDAGMTLGVNHPRGPIDWCARIGTTHVLAILDALNHELGEERYRAAPLLRQHHALEAKAAA